jgi:hypothetical protein
MKRINIVLEEWQYKYLKDRANREEKSISSIIRELVTRVATSFGKGSKRDPIYDIVGLARGKGKGAARRHDEILYGRKK